MCPVLCSGHGDYEDGQCRCFPGWKGLECQLRHDQCEVADCSGHGQCINGKCVCARGYTGHACQQSKLASKNNSFTLSLVSVIQCGFSAILKSHLFHTAAFHFRLGAFNKQCNLGDCPDPSCSDHGFCVEGSCVCRQGWRGPTCATVDHEARQCLPDCSGHGDFDLESQKCICKGQWTGNDCSKGNY